MADEPRWLPVDVVIAFNRIIVAKPNPPEPHFLRDLGLLESACARPQNLWAYYDEEDVVTLATSLAVGIARNHAFEQGNKRTGFASAVHFLELNGYDVQAPDTELLGEVLEAVVLHAVQEETFTEFLRQFVVPNS